MVHGPGFDRGLSNCKIPHSCAMSCATALPPCRRSRDAQLRQARTGNAERRPAEAGRAKPSARAGRTGRSDPAGADSGAARGAPGGPDRRPFGRSRPRRNAERRPAPRRHGAAQAWPAPAGRHGRIARARSRAPQARARRGHRGPAQSRHRAAQARDAAAHPRRAQARRGAQDRSAHRTPSCAQAPGQAGRGTDAPLPHRSRNEELCHERRPGPEDRKAGGPQSPEGRR